MSAKTLALFVMAACVLGAAELEFARMVFTREAAIAADQAGNLYLASVYIGTPAPEDRRGAMALVKRNARGEVQWTAFLGDYVSGPLAVAVNAAGEVFVTGMTTPAYFPTTEGVLQPRPGSGRDRTAFVMKVNGEDGRVLYSTLLGDGAWITAIAAASEGELIVAGTAIYSRFPLLPEQKPERPSGGFVARLNASGSKLVYSKAILGTPMAVAVNAVGDVVVGGRSGTVEQDSPGLQKDIAEQNARISLDGGETWISIPNAPTAGAVDMSVHPENRDLVLRATGRGLWRFYGCRRLLVCG